MQKWAVHIFLTQPNFSIHAQSDVRRKQGSSQLDICGGSPRWVLIKVELNFNWKNSPKPNWIVIFIWRIVFSNPNWTVHWTEFKWFWNGPNYVVYWYKKKILEVGKILWFSSSVLLCSQTIQFKFLDL